MQENFNILIKKARQFFLPSNFEFNLFSVTFIPTTTQIQTAKYSATKESVKTNDLEKFYDHLQENYDEIENQLKKI